MKPIEFPQSEWIYRVQPKGGNDYDFEVIDPDHTPKPQFLYKHYSLNDNSLNGLLNHYFYASHPLQLNDPYDCNKNIFDLNSTSLNVFQNFLGFLEETDSNFSVKNMYNQNRNDLNDLFIEGFWHIMFSKCGIISMTSLSTNIQMWAYYSKLDGFQIKLDTNDLPGNFKGPLKVRYSSVLNRIPIDHDFFLPVLYQIVNKENNWDHESEWRYLVIGPNEMEVPFSLFSKEQKSPHNRKFSYSISAIKEITLGCYFFCPNEHHKIGKNHSIFDLSESKNNSTFYRIQLLDFMISHPEIESKLIFWEKHSRYELIKVPVRIEKKDEKIFEIWFEIKQIVT
jgi:hypothetical protein